MKLKLEYLPRMITEPKNTFKSAIEVDASGTALFIVLLASLLYGIAGLSIGTIITSVVRGVILYFLLNALSSWFAVKIFKSKGNYNKTLIIAGLANVPTLLFGFIYILTVLLNFNEIIIGLLTWPFLIWLIILFVKGFMIAHEINLWKSLVSVFLPSFIVVSILTLITIVFL